MTNALYYTIYLRKNDELVAFGTSAQCAKMLGTTISAFKNMISNVRKGINKKYEFYAEPLRNKIRRDDVQIMRDPSRIDRFCDDLKAVWHELPDWRFGQLMCNLLGEYMAKTGRDPFFPEEDEMINFFREFVDLKPVDFGKSVPEPVPVIDDDADDGLQGDEEDGAGE